MKRIKAAGFPVPKTLAEFDFDFQPKLDGKLIKTLASCDLVERRENVIFVGQPGTGKSHLSVALGMKTCEAGYHVRFTTIQDLAATLRASMADHTTEDRIAEFVAPDLIILDSSASRRSTGSWPMPSTGPSPAATSGLPPSSPRTKASSPGPRSSRTP